MSKPATSGTEPEVRRLGRGSNGWFGWMAGMWVVFFVLLNSGGIDDVAAWTIVSIPRPKTVRKK